MIKSFVYKVEISLNTDNNIITVINKYSDKVTSFYIYNNFDFCHISQ